MATIIKRPSEKWQATVRNDGNPDPRPFKSVLIRRSGRERLRCAPRRVVHGDKQSDHSAASQHSAHWAQSGHSDLTDSCHADKATQSRLVADDRSPF